MRTLALESGRQADDIVDFSANINPLGPPEWLRAVLGRNAASLIHYPDPYCAELKERIATRFSIDARQVVAGNGSEELLFALPRALGARRAIISAPSYKDYETAATLAGLAVNRVASNAEDDFAFDLSALTDKIREGDIVFLGQPNNPTGLLIERDGLLRLAVERPAAVFVIDEAFADFVDGYRSLAFDSVSNMIILRSMTKFYAMPGLRLGYAVASPDIADKLKQQLPPWSVNSLAQAVGKACLDDEAYAAKAVAEVTRLREGLYAGLLSLPSLRVFPSQVNFLLIRLERSAMDALELRRGLLARGIAIRPCDNFAGLDARYFRVAVRGDEENALLLSALSEELGETRAARPARTKKRPSLMFQGTSSNAGKSVLTAALCRILLQDGLRVAPFKAQNMSLNSHVTPDGGEIGRAQALQAQACRIDSDVRMNPVLLKPNSETGSQVIVRGRPVGSMNVDEYVEYKRHVVKEVYDCYDSLAAEYDVLVLEGAGSPGEMNLKSHDIVNMAMARYARSPVLLVGDIDRGGVFASFVGTMEVLSEWERALVAGFVVNRFRGNADLLGPALDYTLAHTGRPVLGVVRFLENLGLQEEDSVSFREGVVLKCGAARNRNGEVIDVAVCDLPHISNFTDLDALNIEDDVSVRLVHRAGDLGNPDLLILPGTKNVSGDMDHLRANGLADGIIGLAGRQRTTIVGICGGFQLLGKEIIDPYHIESSRQTTAGLGLLDLTTELAHEKTLLRTEGTHRASGCRIAGYEIHHGRSNGDGLLATALTGDGTPLAFGSQDGTTWGTYLHGVFDADEFRRWFIDRLREKKGWQPKGKVSAVYDVEPALNRLAQAVRSSLDMRAVYRIMGL